MVIYFLSVANEMEQFMSKEFITPVDLMQIMNGIKQKLTKIITGSCFDKCQSLTSMTSGCGTFDIQ